MVLSSRYFGCMWTLTGSTVMSIFNHFLSWGQHFISPHSHLIGRSLSSLSHLLRHRQVLSFERTAFCSGYSHRPGGQPTLLRRRMCEFVEDFYDNFSMWVIFDLLAIQMCVAYCYCMAEFNRALSGLSWSILPSQHTSYILFLISCHAAYGLRTAATCIGTFMIGVSELMSSVDTFCCSKSSAGLNIAIKLMSMPPPSFVMNVTGCKTLVSLNLVQL